MTQAQRQTGFEIELIGYAQPSFLMPQGVASFDNFLAGVSSYSDSFFGGRQPGEVASDGMTHLMRYALGASEVGTPLTRSLLPITTLATNSSNQTVLTLTYYARTNDTNLFLQPVWHTELAAPTSSWSSNVAVTTLGTTNTNGLVLERRQATVPVDGNSKKFLRLKATLSQP